MSDTMGNKPSTHHIKEFDAGSDEDIQKIWQLWQAIFPVWPISKERMNALLTLLPGHHGLHEHGFYLSFLGDEGVGNIAAIGVLPEHRREGLGAALIVDAKARLKKAAIAAGAADLKSLTIGSSAPRFWPRLPVDSPQGVREFFTRAGTQACVCIVTQTAC